mgnify:CR=1 FL=1
MTEDHQRQDADERPEDDVDFDTEGEDSTQPALDWGLKKPKSGISREIKIGVTILALIAVIFGYVLYKNSGDPAADIVVNKEQPEDQGSPDAKDGSQAKIVAAKNTKTAKPSEDNRKSPPQRDDLFDDPIADVGGQTSEPPVDDYRSSPPAQVPEQPQDDYEDLLAEADAISDARVAADDLATTDLWENNAAAGQTGSEDAFADGQDFANEGFGDLPPEQVNDFPQGNDFSEADTGELTSLEDDTNPYADSTSDEGYGDQSTTPSEPADDPFAQGNAPSESYAAEDFGSESQFAEDRSFGADDRSFAEEPPTEPLEPAADEFGDLAEPSVMADTDRGSPIGAEMTGEIEEDSVDNGFDQLQNQDPRTGQYQNVTQHTGKATSTTIVRRTEESPANIEPEFSGTTAAQNRFNGYRPVDSFESDTVTTPREAAPDQFADDASEFDVVAETEPPGDYEPVVPDNRTYGFDEPQRNTQSFPTETPIARGGSIYVVESNDSFWSIARQTYGDAKYFKALAKYNERTIPDPKYMRPGVEVATPSATELERLYPELFGDVQQASQHIAAESGNGDFESGGFLDGEDYSGYVGSDPRETISRAAADTSGYFIANDGRPQYRVTSGDNLGGIARRHLGKASRWEEIYRLNQDRLKNPDRLKIGTVLRLPDDARREEVVTRPEFGR